MTFVAKRLYSYLSDSKILINHKNAILICIPLLILSVLAVPLGLGDLSPQSEDPLIKIRTDKQSYKRGDSIVISGSVRYVTKAPLTVQILDPDKNLVHIEQIPLATDGTFVLPVKAEGPLWKYSGTYTVLVQNGYKLVSSSASIEFSEDVVSTNGVFNVKEFSSGQNFDINYTISGAVIKNISIKPIDLGLVIEIDSKSQGMIHLLIPRSLMDAKTSSGTDDTFLVLIDDVEIRPYVEEKSDSAYRVLEISFLDGDSTIEIIGTQIIPEFANVINQVVVIGIGIMLIFVILTNSKLKIFNKQVTV